MTIDELRARLIDLYNTYRTALLNRKYYGVRLEQARLANLLLEIVIAMASSAAIGSWAIWSAPDAQQVWASITGVAAVLAVMKPILNLSKQIERYSKLFIGHGDVAYDLERVVREVEATHALSPELHDRYRAILERHRTFATDDDPRPVRKLQLQCFEDVNRTVPPQSLWMP